MFVERRSAGRSHYTLDTIAREVLTTHQRPTLRNYVPDSTVGAPCNRPIAGYCNAASKVRRVTRRQGDIRLVSISGASEGSGFIRLAPPLDSRLSEASGGVASRGGHSRFFGAMQPPHVARASERRASEGRAKGERGRAQKIISGGGRLTGVQVWFAASLPAL